GKPTSVQRHGQASLFERHNANILVAKLFDNSRVSTIPIHDYDNPDRDTSLRPDALDCSPEGVRAAPLGRRRNDYSNITHRMSWRPERGPTRALLAPAGVRPAWTGGAPSLSARGLRPAMDRSSCSDAILKSRAIGARCHLHHLITER